MAAGQIMAMALSPLLIKTFITRIQITGIVYMLTIGVTVTQR